METMQIIFSGLLIISYLYFDNSLGNIIKGFNSDVVPTYKEHITTLKMTRTSLCSTKIIIIMLIVKIKEECGDFMFDMPRETKMKGKKMM